VHFFGGERLKMCTIYMWRAEYR